MYRVVSNDIVNKHFHMARISKTGRVLISILIIFVAYVTLVLGFVQDFGNIKINEGFISASVPIAVVGIVLLIISIFSKRK